MTAERALEHAQYEVFVNMNLGELKTACEVRGIKAKRRPAMESRLIAAIADEWTSKPKEEQPCQAL